MNKKKALELFGIQECDDYSENEIKRIYRAKILQFHPDKNKSPDASTKFIEIQEAYTFLQMNNITSASESEYKGESYRDILKKFLSSMLREENDSHIITKIAEIICKKICTIIEYNTDAIIDYLRNINRDTLKIIRNVLSKYRHVLHISPDIFEKIDEILRVDECILLNPTLDDLLSEENIYILKYNEKSYVVPLWQHEMAFDYEDKQFFVKCFPILPDNMELDECNILTVHLQYNIKDVWNQEILVNIGNKSFTLLGSMLKLTDQPQEVIYEKCGVPYNNIDNVFDAEKRQSIVFVVNLVYQ